MSCAQSAAVEVDMLRTVAVEQPSRLMLCVAPRQRAVQRCLVEDDQIACLDSGIVHWEAKFTLKVILLREYARRRPHVGLVTACNQAIQATEQRSLEQARSVATTLDSHPLPLDTGAAVQHWRK